MKKFFLTTLLSFTLTLPTFAITHEDKGAAVAPSLATGDKPALVEATKTADSKLPCSKGKTKEERMTYLTQVNEEAVTTLTERLKSLTGGVKKMVELQIAHAKLEMDAAKDEDMKNHGLRHIKKAHRYLKHALKLTSKFSKNEKEVPAAQR